MLFIVTKLGKPKFISFFSPVIMYEPKLWHATFISTLYFTNFYFLTMADTDKPLVYAIASHLLSSGLYFSPVSAADSLQCSDTGKSLPGLLLVMGLYLASHACLPQRRKQHDSIVMDCAGHMACAGWGLAPESC